MTNKKNDRSARSFAKICAITIYCNIIDNARKTLTYIVNIMYYEHAILQYILNIYIYIYIYIYIKAKTTQKTNLMLKNSFVKYIKKIIT